MPGVRVPLVHENGGTQMPSQGDALISPWRFEALRNSDACFFVKRFEGSDGLA